MTTFHVTHKFDLEDEGGHYMVACARIRDITLTELVRRLLRVVSEDQLVLAILDDDSKREHNRYQRGYKEAA